MITTLPSLAVMQRAFERKDPSFDGTFFVAVKTTSIFCRPVCRAKPPRLENVEFFPTAQDALYHGYRPCKLCRPLDGGVRPPELVEKLMKLVEQDPTRRLTERDLRELKIDPTSARRQFRAYCRTTFAAYQRARRMGLALRDVRKGQTVIGAQANAGFESSSGFRDAFAKMFGTTASNARDVNVLTAKWLTTPLGPMLTIANDEGIVLCDFVDRKGLERAIGRLRTRCGTRGTPAVIVPGEHRHLSEIEKQMSEYFAGVRRAFSLKLAICGSDFETRSWEFLRTIPFGQTRSYRDEAHALNQPKAIRAVGRANGMNYLSIIIPCHRVIGANGDLTGYGGGLARKRWLLDHERQLVSGGAQQRAIYPASAARSAPAVPATGKTATG
jgi:AraC family transcriptional regulator of adaptative response/methylated-DNA-[protein]-cysteine methyltransferase